MPICISSLKNLSSILRPNFYIVVLICSKKMDIFFIVFNPYPIKYYCCVILPSYSRFLSYWLRYFSHIFPFLVITLTKSSKSDFSSISSKELSSLDDSWASSIVNKVKQDSFLLPGLFFFWSGDSLFSSEFFVWSLSLFWITKSPNPPLLYYWGITYSSWLSL